MRPVLVTVRTKLADPTSGKAERIKVGSEVVPGQRLAERTGPVGHGALADLAAGDRKMGDADGKTAGG